MQFIETLVTEYFYDRDELESIYNSLVNKIDSNTRMKTLVSKSKKPDLIVMCNELGIDIPPKATVAVLKELLVVNIDFDTEIIDKITDIKLLSRTKLLELYKPAETVTTFNFFNLTLVELKKLCKEKGIVVGKSKKNDIVKLLLEDRQNPKEKKEVKKKKKKWTVKINFINPTEYVAVDNVLTVNDNTFIVDDKGIVKYNRDTSQLSMSDLDLLTLHRIKYYTPITIALE
jgi:hypothetical protein